MISITLNTENTKLKYSKAQILQLHESLLKTVCKIPTFFSVYDTAIIMKINSFEFYAPFKLFNVQKRLLTRSTNFPDRN